MTIKSTYYGANGWLIELGDIRILVECGFDGFLIGEQFMSEKDPGSKLKELINSY